MGTVITIYSSFFYICVPVLHTSDHSATGNVDFLPKHNESVSIEGYQSKQLYIDIFDDTKVEDDEQFFVTITGAAVGGGIRVVNVSIDDNDRKLPDNIRVS